MIAAAARGARAPLWLVSLSAAVDAAAGSAAARRIIADRPDAPAMISAIGHCLDDPADT